MKIRTHYSKKEIKLMLKTNSYPIDCPAFVIKEIERRRLEIERNMPSNREAMDDWMKQFQATRWQPISNKRPSWVNWFYRKLGVQKTPKIVNMVKEFFR